MFLPDPDPLEAETCCKCGIRFAMPRTLRQLFLANSRKNFFCPNGHQQHYTRQKSESDKLRAERDRWKLGFENAAKGRDDALERERTTERRLAAQKGHNTRLKKKIATTKGEKP